MESEITVYEMSQCPSRLARKSAQRLFLKRKSEASTSNNDQIGSWLQEFQKFGAARIKLDAVRKKKQQIGMFTRTRYLIQNIGKMLKTEKMAASGLNDSSSKHALAVLPSDLPFSLKPTSLYAAMSLFVRHIIDLLNKSSFQAAVTIQLLLAAHEDRCCN
ncbi:unnamed protein product [Gongylonema pulchrum]|uniref:Uncharacterized protein n=1 Tax=Gongylonema pulchrum TaxID=637853 RepID=A0A3P7MZ96_9BILA|nr:unnamed protein product [Gongylonema pulchrum]